MAIYKIKDSDGNVTNAGINADEAFMAANFDHYEEYIAPTYSVDLNREARMWRDGELTRTDTLHLLDDYPNAANLTTYRAALRAWPASSDFPATRPVLGE